MADVMKKAPSSSNLTGGGDAGGGGGGGGKGGSEKAHHNTGTGGGGGGGGGGSNPDSHAHHHSGAGKSNNADSRRQSQSTKSSDLNNNNNNQKKRKHGGGGPPQQKGGGGHFSTPTSDGGRGNANSSSSSTATGTTPNNSHYNGQSMNFRLTGSPTWDLPPQNTSEQTFTGRCRLFVANLPPTVTEEALRNIFSQYGQISEIFIGKGNQFAFIKMDTRSNAEAAKNAIDGTMFEGRTLRVRLAAHAAAIKVTNLPPTVSNELLHLAFSTFGPIERAIVVADDRGRSLNEGIIEFARKSSAQAAIKRCQTGCLLLTASPIPVYATSLESRDEEEGVPEKNVFHLPEYRKEREIGPRFAEPGTVEYEIAKKWKSFVQIDAERREAFEQEMREKHANFKVQMEYARLEETIKQLQEQLRMMESQANQMNAERDARFDYERQREVERQQHEMSIRQQEEQLVGPQRNPGEMNTLRRQENDLRQQANALQQILDRQEQTLRQMADSNMGQHSHPMDNNNMYGPPPPQSMHSQQAPPNMMAPPPQAQGPPQPPSQVNHQPPPMSPYGHHQPAPTPPSHHMSYQQHQHPQMAGYGQPYGQMPPDMRQPPPPTIVPYNGVPPPPVYSMQQQQQQQPPQPPSSQPPPMGVVGGYNKRRRF